MNRSFNMLQLTAAQEERWDEAMANYRAIQFANAAANPNNVMPKTKTASNVIAWPRQPAMLPEQVEDNQRERQQPSRLELQLAFRKSALLARLLDGKPALPAPPPTSWGYPWYSVIEESGPFPVSVGGVYTLGTYIIGTRGAKGLFGIAINRCLWAVETANHAAKELAALDSARRGLNAENQPLTMADIARAQQLYADAPEFVVRHGKWPPYRLTLTSFTTSGLRNRIGHAPHAQGRIASSVFDTEILEPGRRIGKLISKGQHPVETLAEAEANLEARRTATEPGFVALDERLLIEQRRALPAHIRAYEENPEGYDLLELSYNSWILERTNQ